MLNIKYNEAETLHDRYIEFKAPFTNGVKTVGRVQLFAMNSDAIHIYMRYIYLVPLVTGNPLKAAPSPEI